MSIEQKIEDLTVAVTALTAVIRAKECGSFVIAPEPKTRKSRKAVEEPVVEEIVEEPVVEEIVEEPVVEEPVTPIKEYSLADIQKALMLIASRSADDKAAVKAMILAHGAATTKEMQPSVYPNLVAAIGKMDIGVYTQVFGV